MPLGIELLSLSTEPLRLVHESQYVVMMLQSGAMDLSFEGGPTKRFEYVKGDIALCRRHVVGLVQSPDQMTKLRFELSDLYLSEAAAEESKEIDLLSNPRLRDPRIRALMTAVNIERASGFPSGELFLQSIRRAMSAVLVRSYSPSRRRKPQFKGGLSDAGRRDVLDFVQSKISEDISLADMAAVAGLSMTHFSHVFKKSMGESPHQFVLRRRVYCAKEMLESLNLRMIDVALACGFKTQQHFSRIFRKVCGLTPTEYRLLKLGGRLRCSSIRSSPSTRLDPATISQN